MKARRDHERAPIPDETLEGKRYERADGASVFGHRFRSACEWNIPRGTEWNSATEPMKRIPMPRMVLPLSSLESTPISDQPDGDHRHRYDKSPDPEQIPGCGGRVPADRSRQLEERQEYEEGCCDESDTPQRRCGAPPSWSPTFPGTAPSAEVVRFRIDCFFFFFLVAVLRPLARPDVVRVAMGPQLYPMRVIQPTT